VAGSEDAGIEFPDVDHRPVAAWRVDVVDTEYPRRAEAALQPMPTIIGGVFLAGVTTIVSAMIGIAVTMLVGHSFHANVSETALLAGIMIRSHATKPGLQWLGSDG